ncbi:hypothetical protein PoB_004104800 [Plakobranchus ocellatus]|uniref:Uncharacterized protein n=1 Tax=Plakobranchus ocellatus TaxID=259542 RepID=A0AAV4B4P5_9GAST|nr:hypothetical protein PoB_004104800 [Plakobranchus ocellatus]
MTTRSNSDIAVRNLAMTRPRGDIVHIPTTTKRSKANGCTRFHGTIMKMAALQTPDFRTHSIRVSNPRYDKASPARNQAAVPRAVTDRVWITAVLGSPDMMELKEPLLIQSL